MDFSNFANQEYGRITLMILVILAFVWVTFPRSRTSATVNALMCIKSVGRGPCPRQAFWTYIAFP